MKFDNVIMNPPYDGSLHIKIIEAVLPKVKQKCVNLSPIRWLQDNLARYKPTSDFLKYEETVSKRLKGLESLNEDDVEKWFNTPIPVKLGIYDFDPNGSFKEYESLQSTILHKMIAHKNFEPIADKIILAEPMGYAVIAPLIYKGIGPHRIESEVSHWMLDKDRAFYNNNVNVKTGETYFEYRKKVSWGKVKPRPDITHIKFDTEEERQNFYDVCESLFFRYYFFVETVDVHVQVKFLPWLGNLTNPRTGKVGYKSDWTNEDLCQVFDVSNEDWEEMKNVMKPFMEA